MCYKPEKTIIKDTCIPMFTVALFTIARTWKQPRCPSPDEWIRKLWYIIYNGLLLRNKKEYIWLSSNEVDEPRAYYTEWSKSERKINIIHWRIYMNLEKWCWWTYFQGSNEDADTEIYGHSEGRWGWEELREKHGNINITICRTDSQLEFAIWQGSSNLVLSDSLECWDGVGGGRGFQEGGDICIPMTDSCWCMAKTNTML